VEIHRAVFKIQSIQGCLPWPGYSYGSLCSVLRLRIFVRERQTSRTRGGKWWRGTPLKGLYLCQDGNYKTTCTISEMGSNFGTTLYPTYTPPPLQVPLPPAAGKVDIVNARELTFITSSKFGGTLSTHISMHIHLSDIFI